MGAMEDTPDSDVPRGPRDVAGPGGARQTPSASGRSPAPPPSFTPAKAASRPPASGAQQVGRGQAPGRVPAALPSRNGAPTPKPVSHPPARPPAIPPAVPVGRSATAQHPPSHAAHQPAQPTARAQHPGVQPASAPPRAAAPRTPAPPSVPRFTRAQVRRRRIVAGIALLLAFLLAWPVGLVVWANGRIQHVDALSDAAGTPGRVFLLAGSDSRADGAVVDGTEGQRTDTIMLLTVPPGGTRTLVSLPRDTLVDIPGHGRNKLNASYAIGGPSLLVLTVEELTGMKVDHYVEIGMGGVSSLVDAVGGVELCLDYDVDDPLSGLVWTAGCHEVDGTTALAFARMRYADPRGDIGRGERQQQLISAVSSKAVRPSSALLPTRQVSLVRAGTDALLVDEDTGIIDLVRMARAFRAATGPAGLRGAPPIANPDYRPGGGLGSTVLLDESAPQFFERVANGTVTEADFPTGS